MDDRWAEVVKILLSSALGGGFISTVVSGISALRRDRREGARGETDVVLLLREAATKEMQHAAEVAASARDEVAALTRRVHALEADRERDWSLIVGLRQHISDLYEWISERIPGHEPPRIPANLRDR